MKTEIHVPFVFVSGLETILEVDWRWKSDKEGGCLLPKRLILDIHSPRFSSLSSCSYHYLQYCLQSRHKHKWNMNLCLHLKMTHSKIEFWSVFQMKERSMVSSSMFIIDTLPFDGVWALRRTSEEDWVGKLRTPDEKSNFADFSLGTTSPKLIPGFKCSEGWGAFSVSF